MWWMKTARMNQLCAIVMNGLTPGATGCSQYMFERIEFRPMSSIKAHFDGTSIVLDEPATLRVGQSVQVIVDPSLDSDTPRRSLRGIAKGMFEMRDDFNEPLDEFAEYRR